MAAPISSDLRRSTRWIRRARRVPRGRPRRRAAHDVRGRSPRGRSQSSSTIQSGTTATSSADSPDGTRCSAHATAPLPKQSIRPPAIEASRHSRARRTRCAAKPRPGVEQRARHDEARAHHREWRNRRDGVANREVRRPPHDVHGDERRELCASADSRSSGCSPATRPTRRTSVSVNRPRPIDVTLSTSTCGAVVGATRPRHGRRTGNSRAVRDPAERCAPSELATRRGHDDAVPCHQSYRRT